MFLAAGSSFRSVYRELDIIHQFFWGQVWQGKNLHKNSEDGSYWCNYCVRSIDRLWRDFIAFSFSLIHPNDQSQKLYISFFHHTSP